MNINYAAGVLILGWNGNEICTLLGKDNYNTYSDFGGKCDSQDNNTPYITAAREMYEETLGILYTQYEISYYIYNTQYISSRSFTNKPYYMYILWVDYDSNMNIAYNTAYNYVSSIPGFNHQFKEKKMISWFKLEDVLNGYKVQLRNVFSKTIQNNKSKIKEIALELKARNIKNI